MNVSFESSISDYSYSYASSYWLFENKSRPNCPETSSFLVLHHYPDEWIEPLLYTQTDKFMITIVFPLIITLGVLANSAFLFTIARVQEMRTLTNFYLANLAFADLLFVVITAVNYFYKYTWSPDFQRGSPWATSAGCTLMAAASYIPYIASIGLVTLVSIERFLAICFPLSHRMVNSKSRTARLVIMAWLIAIAFTAVVAPNYAVLQRYCIIWPEKWQDRLPLVVSYCISIKEEFRDIAAVFEFVPFIIALILNTTLYALLITRLSQRDDVSDNKDDPLKAQAQKVRNIVARMLVINGIAFFLCLAPYQVHNMYYFVINNCEGCTNLPGDEIYVLFWVGRCLSVLNSAINPVIYGVTNARYRQAFATAIGCTPKKKSASNISTMVSRVSSTRM